MVYKILYSTQAERDLREYGKAGSKEEQKKLQELLGELSSDPRHGRGQVEELHGELHGLWSRRISHEDRLVYSIDEAKREVTIVSARTHYRTEEEHDR